MIGGQLNPATGVKEGGISVNAQAMEQAALKGYATATDLADYLVKKGALPRRARDGGARGQGRDCAASTCPSCRWPCRRAGTPDREGRVR